MCVLGLFDESNTVPIGTLTHQTSTNMHTLGVPYTLSLYSSSQVYNVAMELIGIQCATYFKDYVIKLFSVIDLNQYKDAITLLNVHSCPYNVGVIIFWPVLYIHNT